MSASQKTQPQFFHSKEIYSANNLNELGSKFFQELPNYSLGQLMPWFYPKSCRRETNQTRPDSSSKESLEGSTTIVEQKDRELTSSHKKTKCKTICRMIINEKDQNMPENIYSEKHKRRNSNKRDRRCRLAV